MPSSWYQVAPVILNKVRALWPSSVLDVGVGFGKYGVLLREMMDVPLERYEKQSWHLRLDGVEAFPKYRNPIHDYAYDNIRYTPIEDCLDSLGVYDVILFIDILEHFPKEQGVELLNRLLEHTNKALIVSTPVNPSPQIDYMGNTYEAHRSRWTPIDFARFEMDFSMHPIDENKALIANIYPSRDIRAVCGVHRGMDEKLLGSIETPVDDAEKLHIAYALPHQWLTGGVKMLVHQISWLKARGHTLDVYRVGDGASALPPWIPADVDRDVLIPHGKSFTDYFEPCDVIMCSWYDQVRPLLATGHPVLYWEQGNSPFFGDFSYYGAREFVVGEQRALFASPLYLAAASDAVADIIDSRFNRRPVVIPNGVDTELFQPSDDKGDQPLVLLVGNPSMSFKRFELALSVLSRLWNEGHRFHVRWICQHEPYGVKMPFPIELHINPPQEQLPQLYARSDILIFLSIYEGFAMPPLEAMAAGIAVICTDCGGPGMFLRNGENALVVQPEDANAVYNATAILLTNPVLRERLSASARETAESFTLDKSFEQLEKVMYAMKRLSIE